MRLLQFMQGRQGQVGLTAILVVGGIVVVDLIALGGDVGRVAIPAKPSDRTVA